MLNYDLSAIRPAWQAMPHYLAKAKSNHIFRISETGSLQIIPPTQDYVITIPAEDARDLAIWILLQLK